MKKPTLVLGSIAVMAVVFAIGAVWFRGHEAETLGALAADSGSTLAPTHAMTLGPEDARVEIVEFFDPACETCAVFHAPVKELLAAHPGRVRLVLRYAPFHAGSEDVVRILEASRQQGRYWETLELLFSSQRLWASHHEPRPELIWQLLPRAGVDVDQIRRDMGSFAVDAVLQQDLADAAALGIRKTPSFLVNGKPLPSFGVVQLQTLVETEIGAEY